MARELNFQNGNDVIKYQDTTNSLDLYLSVDGVPFDLSQLDSMTLKIGNSNGYLLEKPVDLSSVTDPTSGNVSIHLDKDLMNKLVPDDYNIEIWVEINPVSVTPDANDVNVSVNNKDLNPSQAIFPSDGNLSFTVDDNIKSSPFDSINAYPIDDIWNSVQQWKTDAANSISSTLSSQLLDEITHWQGDISDSLKKELLQDLVNDEASIQKQLNDILTQSLDDLINKEVADAKASISTDLHNAMVSDVTNQINILQPQLVSSLHSTLTNELSSELQQDIQNWQSSTDVDLNNKLAQAIVDKTNTMQSNLSSQLTSYIASKLNDYQTNATNTITANITSQVTQSIASQFAQEDSSVRADLEKALQNEIQTTINNTIQQMQQNGDIYATKQQLTDFETTINNDLQKLNIASDISNQIATINNTLNQIPTIENNISSLQSSVTNNSSAIASNAASATASISNLQSSVNSNSSAIASNASNISTLQSNVSNNASSIAANTTLANSLANSLQSSINSNANAISNTNTSINTATNQLQNSMNSLNGEVAIPRYDIDYTRSADTYTTPGLYYGHDTNPINWLGFSAWAYDWDILLKVETYGQTITQTVYFHGGTITRTNVRSWVNGQYVNQWHDWQITTGAEQTLKVANDLNNALYDCWFQPWTANQPLGNENGPAIFRGNGNNGVQYVFATGSPDSNGFAWRPWVTGTWGDWHITESSSNNIGSHRKCFDLGNLLGMADGYYSVYMDSTGFPYSMNGFVEKVSNNNFGDTFFKLYDIDQNRLFITGHNWAGWKGWREVTH